MSGTTSAKTSPYSLNSVVPHREGWTGASGRAWDPGMEIVRSVRAFLVGAGRVAGAVWEGIIVIFGVGVCASARPEIGAGAHS